MSRTTLKTLESLVQIINKITKSPLTEYTRINGRLIPNAGNYHLYESGGGFNLYRMCEGGGVSDVFYAPTKRELEAKLHAFISGYALRAVAGEVA